MWIQLPSHHSGYISFPKQQNQYPRTSEKCWPNQISRGLSRSTIKQKSSHARSSSTPQEKPEDEAEKSRKAIASSSTGRRSCSDSPHTGSTCPCRLRCLLEWSTIPCMLLLEGGPLSAKSSVCTVPVPARLPKLTKIIRRSIIGSEKHRIIWRYIPQKIYAILRIVDLELRNYFPRSFL